MTARSIGSRPTSAGGLWRVLMLLLVGGGVVLFMNMLQSSSFIDSALFKYVDEGEQWLMVNGTAIVAGSSASTAGGSVVTSIDLVSLTVSNDFYVLFNNSALTSWLRHIKEVRSVTFIGPPEDEALFHRNMEIFYPDLAVSSTPIRWVNQTHWTEKYMANMKDFGMPCPYWKVCQQLIKLNVFELRTDLGLDIQDNVLIVDSDTVWSRDVTFINSTDGRVTYFGIQSSYDEGAGNRKCDGSEPIKFTEAITAGPSQSNSSMRAETTLSPFRGCSTPEYPDAITARAHIAHHMLFQYDVMMELHETVERAWNTTSLWRASNLCWQHDFCRDRVAEYELYFHFVNGNHPERVNSELLINGATFMGSSSICSEEEMKCCEEANVVLKGCHDHNKPSSPHVTPKGMCSCPGMNRTQH